ncbi:peptidase M23 [Leptospira weilii]|uniref:peptidase M23 n=1 Tax=Leptospira weilii TaxID=28184 RepID=UPI00201B85E8|nr:peptidase M23 [Leptospira weilii]UPY77364.1 peptidase M23 [Leptospira weilii]
MREKNNAVGFLKKKYYNLGEEITSEVDNRGLTFTKNSFLSYRDNLINKNFQNTTQIGKQIQEGKNQVAGIIAEGESYNQIQGMIQTASNLNKQGEENKERVERLLLESKELANRDVGGGLLDGLQEMIASIQSSLPQDISNNGVAQYIQAQEKELAEKQEKVNELLSHMNSLVTNQNDLSNLQTLLQGSSQAINLAANSAVSKYLDDYAKKLQKDNEERSSNLQKTLLEALSNGDQYKYLREAGYGFRTDGEGISAYRQIYSGEIEIGGSAMKETSYSPNLEYQYIRIETKFNPGNLSVDMMNPNSTRFNAEMAIGIKNYIDNLQKNVEQMFAQFSNKTNEIKEEYAQNQEIQDYKKELYKESKTNILASFQALPEDLKKAFSGEMGGLKGYHEQGSKYNFNQESFKDESGEMKKVGKSMYDGANIDDTVFGGSRELKGSVSVKGIPVEVSYGMQYLIVTSGFDISNLGHNFNLKLVGNQNAESQLATVNQKYEIYKEDIQNRIEKQAKANDAEKESKGFIFTILNGMNGGSGSMGQRFTQAVKSEVQSRVTGAVAEATGLPASLVGALVGGSSMKDAVKAYVKDETVNAISKATGIPAWMISNQMEKMNKPKEQWYQSQEFQMVTTVVAVAAAPFTGGASLMVAMAVGAGLGAATGAASGGLKGALVGAVGGAAGAAVKSFTGGAVTVGLSYSAENGFGASVGVGYGPATVSVGISERGGTTVDLGLTKGGFNAGLSYNSKTGSVSGNAGLEVAKGTSLGISYNEGDGFGASMSQSFDSGINGGLSWSQKGGVGGNIGYEAPGDKTKPKDSLANQMKGAGGTLSFSQRDGVSASLNASGGVNAGNWSQSGGFQANTNFLADKWKADFVSKRGEIEELKLQGFSEEQATALLDARAQAESKAKQKEAAAHGGADALSGAGVAGTRREGEAHVTGFSDDGSEPAHGAPSTHGPDQMIASSGSYEPDGESAGGGKRPLSAEDKAAFWDNWKGESRTQTDASIADLKKMGYDTADIEGKVKAYRDGQDSKPAKTTTTTPVSHPTTQSPGFFTNALNSVVNGAKGLWSSAFGGRTPNGVYNSSGIEAGMDKVLNSKAAYDPGYEQKGANWTPGKLANGEKYSNISYTETKDSNGNSVYEKVYRNYHADGTYTVAGTESSSKAAFEAAKGNSDYRRFTSCNMVNHEISQSFGAVSPFMPEKGGTQYYAGKIYTNLQDGKYNTDTHQYRSVGFEDAEKNASRGGLSIAVNDGHIVTLTGGYTGTQGKASDLNIFQGGSSGVGSMPLHNGFFGKNTNYKEAYFTNGKNLQYYVWEKK